MCTTMQGARGYLLMGGGHHVIARAITQWSPGRPALGPGSPPGAGLLRHLPRAASPLPALTAHDPRRWPRPPLTSQLGKSSLLTIHHFLDVYDG